MLENMRSIFSRHVKKKKERKSQVVCFCTHRAEDVENPWGLLTTSLVSVSSRFSERPCSKY